MNAVIDFPDQFRWLVAGITGSGKSYFVGWLAEQLYEQDRRWIILDTDPKNHIGLIALRKVKLLKIKSGLTYDWWKVAEADYPLLVIPTEGFLRKNGVSSLIEHYKTLLDVLFAARNPVVVFIEEAHYYSKHPYVPDKTLELLARVGRKYRINPVYITQRIQDFPKIIWSNCSRTYIFKWTIPQDVKYIRSMIPDFESLNRELQRHDVLEFDHATGEVRIIPKFAIQRRTRHYG